MDAVRDSVGRNLKMSLRRRSHEHGLSRSSSQRILKKNLQLYPYRIQLNYKVTPKDMEFLVSVINNYHIYGLHIFWDTLYIYISEVSAVEADCISHLGKIWIQLLSLQLCTNSGGGTGLFNLDMTTGREGKLWIQTCQTSLKNIPCVKSCPCEGVGNYMYSYIPHDLCNKPHPLSIQLTVSFP